MKKNHTSAPMKFFLFLIMLSSLLLARTEANETNFIASRIDNYKQIKTISCKVRRKIKTENGVVNILSSVYFKQNDFLHVSTVSPYKRTIIADGERFFSYVQGDSRGFASNIENLDKPYLLSLRNIPGTPMDHLLRLSDTKQTILDPVPDYPKRYGYHVNTAFVVVSLDSQSRIRNVAFYHTSEMKNKVAETFYDKHIKAGENLWVPQLHRSVGYSENSKTTETARFSNIKINEPISESLFVPGNFLPDVEFVDSFQDIKSVSGN